MPTSNREIAQKLQERLEFYLIALAFTVLALAIQTATFGNHLISDLTELLGWATLLVSGAIGLIRLEIFPIAYEKHASLKELEHEVHQRCAAALSKRLARPVCQTPSVSRRILLPRPSCG